MKKNIKSTKSHVYDTDPDNRLAGGYGPMAAKSTDENKLRRLVMSCLLWEDCAYIDGVSITEQIKELVPMVPANIVANMATEARYTQKLRHVPLLLAREMAKYDSHKGFVADILTKVCKRPDETTEFLSLYWADNSGKKTLSAQVKKGLAEAVKRYDEYQLGKWASAKKEIKLRDVLRLTHPRPLNQGQSKLFSEVKNGTIATPDTWEVGLSAAKSQDEKKAVWERLINTGKLPAFAFMKNIRNMEDVGVSRHLISKAFNECHPDMLLPIDFLRAYQNSKDWGREIEDLMYRCAAQWPKLKGHTIFVVDVSGSMHESLSAKTDYNRQDMAAALAVLATECCEHISVYATAGDDYRRVHQTKKVKPLRGFALVQQLREVASELGGGGIFTRQCCEFLRKHEEKPDRIIIFSDSQDCDHPGSGSPNPHGYRNYIVDVSSHQRGINYSGVWTAEISGWSEQFLRFIAETENCQ